MPDLLNCPFCGAAPALDEPTHFEGAGGHCFFVACYGDECPIRPVTPGQRSAEDAAAAWNTRPVLTACLKEAQAEAAEAEREKLQLHEELRGLRAGGAKLISQAKDALTELGVFRPSNPLSDVQREAACREGRTAYNALHTALCADGDFAAPLLHRGTEEAEAQLPGMPEAKCHGCGLAAHVARCQRADCGGKGVAGE